MTDPLRMERPRVTARGEDLGDVLASIRRLIAQDATAPATPAPAQPAPAAPAGDSADAFRPPAAFAGGAGDPAAADNRPLRLEGALIRSLPGAAPAPDRAAAATATDDASEKAAIADVPDEERRADLPVMPTAQPQTAPADLPQIAAVVPAPTFFDDSAVPAAAPPASGGSAAQAPLSPIRTAELTASLAEAVEAASARMAETARRVEQTRDAQAKAPLRLRPDALIPAALLPPEAEALPPRPTPWGPASGPSIGAADAYQAALGTAPDIGNVAVMPTTGPAPLFHDGRSGGLPIAGDPAAFDTDPGSDPATGPTTWDDTSDATPQVGWQAAGFAGDHMRQRPTSDRAETLGGAPTGGVPQPGAPATAALPVPAAPVPPDAAARAAAGHDADVARALQGHPDRPAPAATIAEAQTSDTPAHTTTEQTMNALPIRTLLRDAIREELRGEIGQTLDADLRRMVREEIAAALAEAFAPAA